MKKLRALFRKGRVEQELDDELRFHLEKQVEQNIAAGMSAEEARYAALRSFGGIEQVKEECRDAWGVRFIESFLQDLRFGLRMLAKNPGFTAVAVISLALGIGANATIFSFLNALLLRPPSGIESPHRLSTVWNRPPDGRYAQHSYPDYVYYRGHNQVFSGLLAYSTDPTNVNWNVEGHTEVINGQIVSGNFFSVLGVGNKLGRGFLSQEDRDPGRDPVLVLSYAFWRQRFGSDPAVVGKTLTLNGHSFSVVGVAPAGFTGIETGFAPNFWVPMMMQRLIRPGDDLIASRTIYWLAVVGRLKPRITVGQAQADLSVLAHQLEQAYPESNKGWDTTVMSIVGIPPALREFAVPFTAVLMVVVALVLLMACANATNLVLAKAARRSKEMAVRSALGASRSRIIRQILTESALLSLAAGGVGLLFALWAGALVLKLKPPMLSFISVELAPDWRVLLFTLCVSLLTGFIFGLAPALRSSKVDVVSRLKDETYGTYRRSRLRSVLVIAQVAVCLILLTGAGLCLRSLQKAQSIDPGFQLSNRLAVSLDLQTMGYSQDSGLSFYRQLLNRIGLLHGVRSASLANYLPLGFTYLGAPVDVDGYQPPKGQPGLFVGLVAAGAGYFQTMGIPLVQGREFNEQETATAPRVVIINQEMARRFWRRRNPIGQRISFAFGDHPSFEIVGVVQTGKYRSLRESPEPVMYRPFLQAYSPRATLVVWTAGNPRPMLAAVEHEIHMLDPNLPSAQGETLKDYMSLPLLLARVTGSLLGAFGVLALLLAVSGLYGAVAYSVSERTREIGIRVALGAARSDVLKLVVKQGMLLALIGTAIGMAAALLATRVLSNLLYAIEPTDALTFVTVSVLLIAVALLASYIPARRATKVDPMVALRYE